MNSNSHSEKFFKLLDTVTDSLSNTDVLSAWSLGTDISSLTNGQKTIVEISSKVNQNMGKADAMTPTQANQLILYSELMSGYSNTRVTQLKSEQAGTGIENGFAQETLDQYSSKTRINSLVYRRLLHELNNKLTIILGYARVLNKRLTQSKKSEYLDEVKHIIDAGEEASDLIVHSLSSDTTEVKSKIAVPENGVEDIELDIEREIQVETETTDDWKMAPTLLIADDDLNIRQYLSGILKEHYQILHASDGEQALEKTRENAPDLMILDLVLPKVNGLEVCATLKSDENTRATKIIVLTGRIDEETKLAALEKGADDFLVKPFGEAELLTRLRNLASTVQLENSLRARNKTLSDTLSEMKKLQASLIQSEKLNALGSLSAGLLHEINNPLNYAMTATQLLKVEPALKTDPLLNRTVMDAIDGMERIRKIIRDLRSFAYPSEAQKHTAVHFQDALDVALRFASAETQGCKVEVDVKSPDLIYGIHSHIVQVLVNLISNAARALKDSKKSEAGSITVSGERLGPRYMVRVRDNGVGIEKEILNQILDPFFTTREVGDGMGMGLSICNTIVENHGGKLEVDSELNEWTEFRFDLKVLDSEG